MLISLNLHKKRSEVSIETRSTSASLSFKGQATKHTTVKWPIGQGHLPLLGYHIKGKIIEGIQFTPFLAFPFKTFLDDRNSVSLTIDLG